jgi:hypothetical protein
VPHCNSERHPDTASDTTPSTADYSAEESADEGLKPLVGAYDCPTVARHDADLQSPLLLGRAPMQTSPQRAYVSRVTNCPLEHEGENLEIFCAYFPGSLNLVDNVRRRTQEDILPEALGRHSL